MPRSRFISLALKNALVYMLLIVVSSFLIGYILYSKSGTIIKGLSQQELKNSVNIGDVKFGSFIQNIKQDIAFLSSNPYLMDYVSHQNSVDNLSQKEKINKEYFAFLSKKPDYFQLRFISIKGNGKEVIRVERSDNQLKIVTEDQLQNKGDRDYYRETIKMAADSIYFSRIDLNKEYGKISQPIIPTLRAACPIYQADTVFGILVLNVDLRQFFGQIKSIANTNYQLYLFNDVGHFLIHPDSAETFGFEYNRPPTLYEYIPISLAKIRNSFQNAQDLYTAEEIFQVKHIPYPRKDYILFLSIGASSAEILSPLLEWRDTSIMITLLLTLVFMGLAIWWMRRQTIGLKSITRSMTSLANDQDHSDLPVNRNDEIGILARTFKTMSDTITQNISTLENAKEKAELATKEKEEFLENMSHEIRNPLQSILGMTELLIRNEPKTEQLPLLDTLKFSTTNLHTLVNDVLDYSKLKVGELELVETNTKLDQLLKQIIKSYAYQAVKKQIKLQLNIDPALEDTEFSTDFLRLTQIVTNLLSNAIKFTPEHGSVWIFANLIKQNEAEFSVEIVVKDTGVGIKYENYNHILERFKKADSPQIHHNRHGAGLGLPIIIQLLDLFNSQLNIHSIPGKGSEFKFYLNMKKAKNPSTQILKGSIPREETISEKLNILIFDDDIQSHSLYEHLLEPIADHFINLKSSADLKTIPEGLFYDIIICDYWINKDKITAYTEELLKILNPTGICILVTGATANPEELMGDQLELFDMFFQKPIPTKTFLEDLKQTLAEKNYQTANLNNLYEDYDFDEAKVIKALSILKTEWKGFETELISTLTLKDPNGFAEVFHKALSSFRRFELNQLIKFCNFLGANIANEKINSISNKLYLERIMQYHLKHIVFELKKWELQSKTID